jgi:hypothetical protein
MTRLRLLTNDKSAGQPDNGRMTGICHSSFVIRPLS